VNDVVPIHSKPSRKLIIWDMLFPAKDKDDEMQRGGGAHNFSKERKRTGIRYAKPQQQQKQQKRSKAEQQLKRVMKAALTPQSTK